MASTNLEELLAKLNGQSYTPLTEEEMQKKAQNRYGAVYDAKELAAQQAYDTEALLLDQQLAGLDATYQKQLEHSQKNYAQTASDFDRASLGRGMQRSSYNAASLANIGMKGAEAQQAILDTQAAQTKNITEQKNQLGSQLAAELESLSAQEQADILAYLDELENQQYDRGQDANQLAMQIYEYQNAEALADQEYAMWKAEFDAKYGGGSGGSGGGGGGSRSSTKTSTVSGQPVTTLVDALAANAQVYNKDSAKNLYNTLNTKPSAQSPLQSLANTVSSKNTVGSAYTASLLDKAKKK